MKTVAWEWLLRNLSQQISAMIRAPLYHCVNLHDLQYRSSLHSSPQLMLNYSWSHLPLSLKFIILPFKFHFDFLLANISLPIVSYSSLSQIPLEYTFILRYKSSANTNSTDNVLFVLRICMIHLLWALVQTYIYEVILKECLVDIIQSHSLDI